MPDLECRLAKIEERVEIMQSSHKEVTDKLDKLIDQQQKQIGFIGGVSFALTVIASGLAWILNHGFKITT